MNKDERMENVSIDRIKVFFKNPRHEQALNELDAIEKLFNASGHQKMINLTEDIIKDGLIPSDLPILVQDEKNNNYYFAYEGNRRVACIKCIINPKLIENLNANIYKKFLNLQKNFQNKVPKILFCLVTTEDLAIKYIDKLHSKNKAGVSRDKWTPNAKDKFNFNFFGESKTPALQIIEAISSKLKINIGDKIDYSNIERLFDKPDTKKIINIESYFNLSLENTKKINYIIDSAIKESDENKISISRLFNKVDVIKTFIGIKNKEYIDLQNKNPKAKEFKPKKLQNPKWISKAIRRTLIDKEWTYNQLKILPNELNKIKSLIHNLSKIEFDSEKIPNNLIIIALPLRALLEYCTFLFLVKIYPEKNVGEIEDSFKGLQASVMRVCNYMVQNKLLTKTQNKIFENKNLINVLQGSVHDPKISIDLENLKGVFDTYKEYLEICIKKISLNFSTPILLNEFTNF